MREEQVVRPLELRRLVREFVEALDDQELEEALRMPSRPATGSHNRLRQRLLDGRDEEIPVHHPVEPVVDVAEVGGIREPHGVAEPSGWTAGQARFRHLLARNTENIQTTSRQNINKKMNVKSVESSVG